MEMTVNEYQIAALKTLNPGLNKYEQLLDGLMGLCGEVGECMDLLKKTRFQGHDMDYEHLAKELGDVAWYLAVTAYAIGYDLETVFQLNLDKLKNRYPEGFDVNRSINRKENDI